MDDIPVLLRNSDTGWRNKSKTLSHLREEGPLVLGLLDAVGHQPFHGLGAVLVELAEVWGQIASSHHEDDLPGRRERDGQTPGDEVLVSDSRGAASVA